MSAWCGSSANSLPFCSNVKELRTGSATTDLTATILNMQYASAHEVLPNAPIDDVWKDKPREGKGSTIPTQSCTECASGTHTANESYSAGSLWSTFGQWGTIYKIKDTT